MYSIFNFKGRPSQESIKAYKHVMCPPPPGIKWGETTCPGWGVGKPKSQFGRLERKPGTLCFAVHRTIYRASYFPSCTSHPGYRGPRPVSLISYLVPWKNTKSSTWCVLSDSIAKTQSLQSVHPIDLKSFLFFNFLIIVHLNNLYWY
jgi:hypothetical protein